MKAEHWPAKQVISAEIFFFLCQSYFGGPPTGEESALDGAEQAAAPGVVLAVSTPFFALLQATLRTIPALAKPAELRHF